MRQLIIFLILILALTSCSKKQEIPRIDQSVIKIDDLIWDLDALQQAPDFEYLDSTSSVREFLFKGPDYNGKSTKVFGYYSNPDIMKTGKNQGNAFPGVVLISGGHQPAFKEWVERWTHEGYAAITCDYGNNLKLPEGGPTSSQELIYDSISKGPKEVRAYRTVAISILAHSLLLSFPEVDKCKTAVTGISWGGFQTCIVSGIDNRFKAAAPVYGCAFHDENKFNNYLDNNMTEEGKKLWMNTIDPKNYLVFSQCPTLFITGNKDEYFDIVPFEKTTELISRKNRHIQITPNMLHDHPSGWEPREIVAFFNSILMDGIPLPKITDVEKQLNSIKFSYESSLSLKNASFYYSNDTISKNSERIWRSIPAKVFEEKIECPYPKEGFLMGFLYVNDVMGLGVSSELIN